MARPLWLGRLRFARTSAAGAPTDAPAARPLGQSPFVRSLRKAARNLFLRLQNFIGLIFLVVEGIVAVRIIFKATGANPTAGFSSFIYSLSSPFVGPFHPVFTDGKLNGHPFEWGSLLAMAVFAALAFLALRVMRAIFSPRS
jgi:YggT family protein